MTSWLNGKVVENRHWTETLFSLRVEAPKLTFQAGQFVRIALGEVARPFSFVNAPQDPLLEFYGVIVPEGPLSPRLARLRAGDTLRIASNPAGFLVLSEVPDAQTLWLLDAIGDLYLMGKPVLGAFTAHKSGHARNNQLVRARLADKSAFEVVSFDRAEDAPAGILRLARQYS